MREILFRGKRIDNGEWVYGSLVIQSGEWLNKDEKAPDEYWIYGKRGEIYLVDSSTIGQYTGLTANDKKIFEGDIVKIISVLDDSERVTAVMYDSGLFGVKHEDHSIPSIIPLRAYDVYSQIEVIGNIHDNPELLEDKP